MGTPAKVCSLGANGSPYGVLLHECATDQGSDSPESVRG
jgi:hypothetical protein